MRRRPNPDQVREGDVGTDADAVLECERDRPPHHVGIAAVEPAGDVGRRQARHQRVVVPERPAAVGLTHVRVQIDSCRHRDLLRSLEGIIEARDFSRWAE